MLMPSIFGNDFMNDFFGGFPYKSNGTMQKMCLRQIKDTK